METDEDRNRKKATVPKKTIVTGVSEATKINFPTDPQDRDSGNPLMPEVSAIIEESINVFLDRIQSGDGGKSPVVQKMVNMIVSEKSPQIRRERGESKKSESKKSYIGILRAIRLLAAIERQRAPRGTGLPRTVAYDDDGCVMIFKSRPEQGEIKNLIWSEGHYCLTMEKRDFGGVPLLSRDILEIAKSLKTPSSKPYLIFATSGRILNDKLYLGLKKAGVDRFSIALDFPDERHDAFRESPGLFRHLSKLVPKLTSFGGSDIVLTSTITKYNLRSLLDIYNRALEWNANVSFSAYTPLRTGRMEHFINSPDELVILRETIHELMRLKKSGDRIVNSDWALAGTYSQFSDREQMPGCTTGKKFLTVQPDQGIPLLEKFTAPSTCDSCFEAIRACLCEHYWASKWDNVSREIFRKNGTKSSS